MSYEIELTGRAEKEILKLPAAMFERIKAAIDGLGENPRHLIRHLLDRHVLRNKCLVGDRQEFAH